ncbi:MAG: hypothetical protein RL207_1980 [Bacteroidota bacterium]|jgi:uncharacterized delta-60 repeat protein
MKFLYSILVCLVFSQVAFSQAPGSLDLTFATIGYTSFGPTSTSMDNAQDIVSLANGKMVFCGTSGTSGNLEMCVGQMNADGSMDLTFGTNGYYIFSNPGGSDFAYDMEVLPNGNILVAGALSITAANPKWAMICLNPNGTLNTSFGTGGVFSIDIDSSEDYARKILLTPTHIVLAGNTKTPGFSTNRMAVVRCDYNGALDLTFGSSGIGLIANGQSLTCWSAAQGSNGDLILAGDAYISNTYYPMIAKFNASGAVATTFATGGVWVNMAMNARYFDVDFHNSQLILSGNNGPGLTDFLLESRSETNAAANLSFGTNGQTIININQSDTYYEVIFQPDGKILACGTSGTAGIGAARDFVVSRYNANGTLDLTWGTNGHTLTNIFTNWDDAYGMDLYPGNKLVLGGFSAQTNTQFAFARYVISNNIPGCMNPLACNYNPLATVDDGSCILPGSSCNDNNPNTINDSIGPNCNCVGAIIVPGCTDPLACNYNPLANQNNGTCIYPGSSCDDGNPNTTNDSIGANCNCVGNLIVPGCIDPFSCNYNPLATIDDGSCLYPGSLCNDNNPNTINDSINPDCLCIGDVIVPGCTDPLSCNYNPLANQNDGSCTYPDAPCDDNNPDTMNDAYNSSCDCVGMQIVPGCMDPNACNFNPLANVEDNSCLFPGDACDDGDATTINDVYSATCECAGQTNGLDELTSISSVYPNPTSDLVIIEFTGIIEGAILQLCDVQGRILFTKNVLSNKETISVGQFETGTYFLSIIGTKQAIVKQIIIE